MSRARMAGPTWLWFVVALQDQYPIPVLKTFAIFVFGLLMGVGGAMAYHWQMTGAARTGTRLPETLTVSGGQVELRPGSAAAVRPTVMALGTLEPKGGIIHVASPLVGHRIEKIACQEGASVGQGDLLVQLDSAVDQVELQLIDTQLADARQRQQAEIEKAEQGLRAAQLALQQLRDGRELELAAQAAKLAVTQSKAKQAEIDLDRLISLRKLSDPLVSDQQVQQQSILLEVARSEQQATEIGGKKLVQSLQFQLQNAEAEQQAAERALRLAQQGTGIMTLEQQRRLAEIKLQQTRITAPIAGTVLTMLARTGEVVGQSPLLQLAQLENMVCVAEVDASHVQHLHVGQKAVVSSSAFRGPFPGTGVEGVLERFGSVVARAALQPLDPRKPVDRHVVQVVVSFEAADAVRLIFGEENQDPTALVGLQVEVRFREPARRAVSSP